MVSQDKASQSMAEVQPPAEEEAKHENEEAKHENPNKISMQGVARLDSEKHADSFWLTRIILLCSCLP